MNFEPRTILLPLAGNNADSRTVSVRIMNDAQASPQQLAQLAYRLDLHLTKVRNSLAGFITSEGQLEDSSSFRMVSNSGLHVVMLWPAGKAGIVTTQLPHGFAAVAGWHVPAIYKFRPGSNSWQLAQDAVPQITKRTMVAGYNQVARLAGTPAVVYPALHDSALLALWDYGPHPAPVLHGATYSVPADLQYPDDMGTMRFRPMDTHYLMDNVVRDGAAAALYTMVNPGALLAPPNTEPITPLPGCTDATGTTAALQLLRKALISQTADTWIYRFCNETITRTAKETYASTERNVTDVNLPINGNDTASDTSTLNAMGFGPPVPMFAVVFDMPGTVTMYLPPFDANGDGYGGTPQGGWAYSTSRNYIDLTGAPADTSYQRTLNKTAGATITIDKAVALPAVDTVEHAKLQLDLHYPATMYLRGGTRTWASNYSPVSGTRGISRQNLACKRIDVQHDVSGAPDARLDLGWTVVHLFQGTTTAHLYGGNYVDTETDYKRGGDFPAYNYAITGPNPVIPQQPDGGYLHTDLYNAWTAIANVLPGYLSEWEAFPVPDPPATAGSNNSATNVNTSRDDALTCTGSYSLKSRHVIDYDHRSRFFAAIRVEVICNGAQWGQAPIGYKGQLAKTADPTYTVNIVFESNWNGAAAEQLLATSTCTRPAFEFGQRFVRNVYIYPADDTTQPLQYWLPPELGLPKEVMSNLVNLSLHQGVNPHQVARMVYPTVPDGVVSQVGIEYTGVKIDGASVSTTGLAKFVDGQLYARTFKLSDADIKDALWMLHALCVDAPNGNSYPTDGTTPTMWFYMPDLGAIVQNTTFHVELRNGVIVQWSDDLTGAPADPTTRDIKLYEV